MDDLSAAFDDEFGQDWGAEDEDVEEDNNSTLGDPVEGDQQDAMEMVEAFQPADDDIGDEEGDESLHGSLEEQAGSLDDAPSDCLDGLQELEELAAAEEAAASTGAEARNAPSIHQPATVDSSDARAAKRRRTAATGCPGRDTALLADGRNGGVGDGLGEDADIELPCSQGTRSTGPVLEPGNPAGHHPRAAGVAAVAPSQQQQQCEHPSYWAGMCVCCGALKPEEDGAGVMAAGGDLGVGAGLAAVGGRRGFLRAPPRPSTESTAPSSTPTEQLPPAQQLPTQAAAQAPAVDAGSVQGGGTAPRVGSRRNPPKQPRGLRTPGRAIEGLRYDLHGVQGPGTSLQQQQHQPEQLTRIRHLHERGHMEVSMGEAMRVRQREVARLLSSRRLVLILDLDHTLLHSVRLAEVPPEHVTQLEAIQRAESGGEARLLHCLRLQNLWTKLRPGVYEFLEACRGLFEMHIYTMGDRSYAAQIRALLDPQRRLFSSVISQNDSTSTAAKNLDVALADDRIVLILDDTEHVWPHHRRNLIQVERYHFFPGTMRPVEGISGLLDLKLDESSSQGTLASVLGVLQDVHSRFFGSLAGRSEDAEDIANLPLERRDVRYCLLQRREEILKGCHLCFSHCWPQAFPDPYSHPLWQLAESLGAECSKTYDRETTTHMVAGSAATEKAIQAKRHGKHVVAPDWLKACMFRWRREDETKYVAAPQRNPQLFMSPLAPLQMAEATPPPSHPPPHPEGAPHPDSVCARASAAAPSPPAGAAAAPPAVTPLPPAAAELPAESAAAKEAPGQGPLGVSDACTQEQQQAEQQAVPSAAAAAAATAAPTGPSDSPAVQQTAGSPVLPGTGAHTGADVQRGAGSPVLPGSHSIQGGGAASQPQIEASLAAGAVTPQQDKAADS